METSIKIKEETKKKLNLLKYKLGLKSIDEVIQSLLNITTQVQLASHIKDKEINKK